MTNKVSSILQRMAAENLLAESSLLDRISSFSQLLKVNDTTSFDAYYESLLTEVDNLPRLKIANEVPNQQGDRYIAELINNLDELQDAMQRTELRIVNFLARLKDAETDSEVLCADFEAWYILAANEELLSSGTKLPPANVKSIARSEFSRLMNRSNVGLTSLVEAVKILQQQVKTKQKMAKDKFTLGQQQANASWSSNLPTGFGISPDSRPGSLIPETEIEEEDIADIIPSYVSKLAPPDVRHEDTTPEADWDKDPAGTPEEEIAEGAKTPYTGDDVVDLEAIRALALSQGEPGFTKYGDAQPVTIITPERALELMAAGEQERASEEKPDPIEEVAETPVFVTEYPSDPETSIITNYDPKKEPELFEAAVEVLSKSAEETPKPATVHTSVLPVMDDLDDILPLTPNVPITPEAPIPVPVTQRKKMVFAYEDEE